MHVFIAGGESLPFLGALKSILTNLTNSASLKL